MRVATRVWGPEKGLDTKVRRCWRQALRQIGEDFEGAAKRKLAEMGRNVFIIAVETVVGE